MVLCARCMRDFDESDDFRTERVDDSIYEVHKCPKCGYENYFHDHDINVKDEEEMDKIEELLDDLTSEAYIDGDTVEVKNQIKEMLDSPEFIAELMGIKKDGEKWVHPLVGVVEGIDECKTNSDVVCRLLEAKHGASEAMEMLNGLGIEYTFEVDEDGSHRITFHCSDGPVVWTSGTAYAIGETVWTRLIDFIVESKVNKNSWLYDGVVRCIDLKACGRRKRRQVRQNATRRTK